MGVKGEKTREKIVKTARHLFRHQGYKNTTIEDITEASGVQRGNLYFYFNSKEELAHAVIEDARQREFPFIQKIMGEAADPLTKVERMMEGMAGYIIQEQCQGGWLFGNLALELGDSNRGLAEAAHRFFVEWHQLLCGLFAEAKDQGQLRPEADIPGLSRLVMSALEGAILICKASKDESTLLKTVEMIKTVIAGYKTGDPG